MTESQKAFEAWLQSTVPMHNTRNIYSTGERDTAFAAWQASRKQSLEKLQAIFHRAYPSTEAQLAAIKELIK